MEAGSLQFRVEKAKVNWSTYFQDMFRPKFGGGFKSYSGKGPSIVVENQTGEKRVVEMTNTVKEARDRAATIEQDFKKLSTPEWCERYGIPVSFVSG